MKIGELSAKTGCPITRIRFYEQKGVMLEPKRGLGGQREYEKDDVTRLEFIMACRVNGMKLECIKRFLEYLDDKNKGSLWLYNRVNEYLKEVEVKKEQLDLVEGFLTRVKHRLQNDIVNNHGNDFKDDFLKTITDSDIR